MEMQWRTIANDARHVLAGARLPPSYWWYAVRGSVAASWAIPFNDVETPWFRWTGRKPSALKYRVIGCLAYYRVRKPSSKAEMRGRAASIYLGLAEDQAGHLFIDIETGTRVGVVTPHARFVEDEFPGLRRSARGAAKALRSSTRSPMRNWLLVKTHSARLGPIRRALPTGPRCRLDPPLLAVPVESPRRL